MLQESAVPRDRPDACPGLLRPHLAADGGLIRVRLAGGRLSAAQLVALVECAERFGDGRLRLTSRGNVQLRGAGVMTDGGADPGLVSAIQAAGLLPSVTHERVRNLLCSPLTGLSGGLADLRPALAALDRMLCAAPGLAGLSGRMLFGLDDGRGDIAALGVDLGAMATAADRAVLCSGRWSGEEVTIGEVPTRLIGMAEEFLSRNESHWRVTESVDGGAGLLRRPVPFRGPAPKVLPFGTFRQRDGRVAMLLGAPLGLVGRRRADVVAALEPESVIITPDRSVLLTGLAAEPDPAPLAAAGWLTAPGSNWAGISACAGSPGCAKSNGDTGSAAAEWVARNARTALRVHVAGCERRCGAPRGPHREVLLTPAGPVQREVTG